MQHALAVLIGLPASAGAERRAMPMCGGQAMHLDDGRVCGGVGHGGVGCHGHLGPCGLPRAQRRHSDDLHSAHTALSASAHCKQHPVPGQTCRLSSSPRASRQPASHAALPEPSQDAAFVIRAKNRSAMQLGAQESCQGSMAADRQRRTWDTGARPCAFLLNWIMKPSRVCCVPFASCRRMTAHAHTPVKKMRVCHAALCSRLMPRHNASTACSAMLPSLIHAPGSDAVAGRHWLAGALTGCSIRTGEGPDACSS